tara:strand:+ start:141 stop:1457 length:1317 start_codon:yes stop_codon:yes gene_type:complete
MSQNSDFNSYYHQTQNRPDNRQELDETLRTDVCVIGGGLAGINALLGLSERKITAVLLEAKTLGFGASGKNGGFLSAGYSVPIRTLEKKYGRSFSQELYKLSIEGVEIVRKRAQNFEETGAKIAPGIVRMSWGQKAINLQSEIEYMNETFGSELEYWTPNQVRNLYSSDRYNDAIFNPAGYQLHSLNYIHRCADKAEKLGARIFENSLVINLERCAKGITIKTQKGRIYASKVIICISASKTCLNRKLFNAILPIGTYVLLTEPLNDQLKEAIRAPYAVSDSRRVENYYRPLASTQILWGGGIGIRQEPAMLKKRMLKDLLSVYPQLAGVQGELAWPGTMGYARHQMPQIGRLSPNIWYSQGFGGHGLNTATIAGELIAQAISDNDDRYRLFEPFRLQSTARPMGLIAAQFMYWNWVLRDILDTQLSKKNYYLKIRRT